MSARILVQSPDWDTVPFPEVDLQPMTVSSDALQLVHFDEDSDDWLSSLTGSSSAPRLRRIQSVDIRQYAQRAQLGSRRFVTVVLSLEVRPDGTVRAANVIRTCGDARTDAIAMDYARRLNWFPGTVDQQPQTMRIVFPVTLAQ